MLGRTMRIAGLLLLLLPLLAQAETRLESLVWEDGVLILGFDGPYESRSMVMANPDRIVMDFPEVQSVLQRHVYGGSGALEGIRIGQNAANEAGGLRVRVVMDLNASQNFLSEQAGNYLRVVLSPGSGEDLGVQAAAGAHSPSVSEAPPTMADASPVPVKIDGGAKPVSPDMEEDPYELPMFAESTSLPEPPPEVEEADELPKAAAPIPGRIQAGMGTPNPFAELPDDDAPVKTTELDAPDLNREDPAPVGWEDSVSAEFNRLFEGQVESSGPVSAISQDDVAIESETDTVEEVAEEAQVVFYGDPFELVDDDMPASPEPAADVAEPAVVEITDESTEPVVRVEAKLPEASENPTETKATPIGMPVVLGADMGASSDWEVEVSAAPVVVQEEPEAAAVTVPVVKFTRPQATENVDANRGRALMQVASAETPRTQARTAAPADEEAAMRKAMMAGHNRVKPDEANISLEMRGAEFGTLLRAFSEFAGINIVAGRDVKGKVSVNLKEVPWREALSAVCSAHGYSVKEEHGLLRVAPLSSLLKEEMELLTAHKKRSEYRSLRTEVVKLSYAVAGELVAPLSRMLGERGKMDIDSRTNSLLITDLPEAVAHMVALAKALDHQIPQVEITARIVDVDYAASRDMGIKWEALNLVNSSAGMVGSGGVDGTFPSPVGEFKMAKVHDWGEINVTLQAMEKENKANIISNPRVMTMDNREASILVGKKIPLIVADEAGNAVTQLTTIGIKLVVTPHINPDGRIVMDVLTEVSDLASEATVQGGVIITTSESKTNVMVDNGETAVIAGLLKASDSTLDSEVPFFGKIPILGKLFGYNNKSESKRELVIFITPRVITPGSETTADDLTELGYTIPLDG